MRETYDEVFKDALAGAVAFQGSSGGEVQQCGEGRNQSYMA